MYERSGRGGASGHAPKQRGFGFVVCADQALASQIAAMPLLPLDDRKVRVRGDCLCVCLCKCTEFAREWHAFKKQTFDPIFHPLFNNMCLYSVRACDLQYSTRA
jgi:hypothetical protein